MNLSLSNGEVAVIDDDFAPLLKWKWQRDSMGYPSRGTSFNGKKRHVRLHTVIMGPAPEGFVTDHIDGNKLDNRRANLRFCTQRVNTLNKKSGVSWHKGDQAWRVRFCIRGRELYYGNFKDEAEARSIAALLKGALLYHELTKGDSSGQ
jgi:HNH endonuclease